MALLEIKNLHTYFYTDSGIVRAVDGVDLSIDKGGVVSVVGGSGGGKTILALSILGLVPEPGRIVHGEILYNGLDLTKISTDKLRAVRGKGISMIFQEPMTALNPVFTIGNQIVESITTHDRKITSKEALGKAGGLLELVGIADPHKKLDCYPHELSGGMRQRVMIAMALAGSPDILIADEPTTALDVTIQAQILDLMSDLQERLGLAVIFITHDFGIVAKVADKVYVMHNGKVVEMGDVIDIFDHPRDDYTKKLLTAVPVL